MFNHLALYFWQQAGKWKWMYRLGTWNVCTLYQAGAFQELRVEAQKLKVDIFTIQEVRWTNNIVQKTDYTRYYSNDKDRHEFSSGSLVNDKLKGAVLDSSLSVSQSHLWICSWCGEWGRLHKQLERVYDSCPKHNIMIFLSEFNAQIGKKLELRPTIAMDSLHHRTSANKERLVVLQLPSP